MEFRGYEEEDCAYSHWLADRPRLVYRARSLEGMRKRIAPTLIGSLIVLVWFTGRIKGKKALGRSVQGPEAYNLAAC
jgi:hypothetical protein